MPEELDDYLLCVEMYRCPPSVLDAQDWKRVQTHWHIHNQLNLIREKKRKKKK